MCDMELGLSICRTCLAGDRKLEAPGRYQTVLDLLAPHLVYSIPLEVGLCWECRSVLRRLQQFTQRAQCSGLLLQQYWSQACVGQVPPLETLTKQCQTTLLQKNNVICVSSMQQKTTESHVEADLKCNIQINSVKSEYFEIPLTLKEDEVTIKPEPLFDLDDEVPLINHRKEKARKKTKNSTRQKSIVEGVNLKRLLSDNEDEIEQDVSNDDASFEALPSEELNDAVCSENDKKKVKRKTTKTLKATKLSKNEIEEVKKVHKKKKTTVDVPPEEQRYRTVLVSEQQLAMWRIEDGNTDRYATMRLPHKCTTCLLPFRWAEQLEQHNSKKHNETLGEFSCDVCACRFPAETELLAHRELHLTRYECLQCDYATRDKKAVDKHYEVEHCEAKYKCTICGKAFKTFFQQRYHREAAHRPRWECQYCDKTFRLRGGLYSHMRIHKELPKAECPICGKVYKNKYALMYHLRVHEDSQLPFYCRPCDVHFKSKNQLRLHTTTSMKHVTPDKLKFACEACGRRFITDKRREHHYNTLHLNKTEFACTECSKAYANKQSLRSHILRKHKQKVLPRDKICDICGKGFHNNVLLRNHMRTHTGERPFHCKLCPSTFSYSAALYTHNRLVHLKMKRAKTHKKKSVPAIYPDKTQWEGEPYSY